MTQDPRQSAAAPLRQVPRACCQQLLETQTSVKEGDKLIMMRLLGLSGDWSRLGSVCV